MESSKDYDLLTRIQTGLTLCCVQVVFRKHQSSTFNKARLESGYNICKNVKPDESNAISVQLYLDESRRKMERHWLLPLKLKELMENLHAISIHF